VEVQSVLAYRRWRRLEVGDDRFRIGVAQVIEDRQGITTRETERSRLKSFSSAPASELRTADAL